MVHLAQNTHVFLLSFLFNLITKKSNRFKYFIADVDAPKLVQIYKLLHVARKNTNMELYKFLFLKLFKELKKITLKCIPFFS